MPQTPSPTLQHVTVADVARALSAGLPGPIAHELMATRPRASPSDYGHSGPARLGAVLVLLYPVGPDLHFPLTRRTDRVANHRGQIALPGGAREVTDAALWHTALRETGEELGAPADSIQYVGALSPLYIPVSHFQVQPFVGHVAERPSFVPDPTEVAELIEMPLARLLDPEAKGEEVRILRGRRTVVPFYRLAHHVIWGATAMILSELEVALSRLAAQPG
ncbi:MAG: CoA pyrophosphatase [Chloroflexi bacterium]|nr:CoA pyrophosphatase [Chloroflexota bacterium]